MARMRPGFPGAGGIRQIPPNCTMHNRNILRLPAALCCLLLFHAGPGPLRAAAADDGTLIELDPYRVEGRANDSARQRAWLFEAQRLLVDPAKSHRTVTYVGTEALEAYSVWRIEDVYWRVPGAVRQGRFGVETVPVLRGDAAEALFNGQRRGDNLFGLPPGFAYIEGLEVVAGPPLLSSGPGKRTGGMVNFVSLQPRMEGAFGSAVLRLGSWLPGGGSFTTVEGTLDVNVPLAGGQALRLVANWRDDATFYRRNGGRDDARELYLAWRRAGAGVGTLDAILLYQDNDRPQTLGVNRPWQGLIDHGWYVTGGVDAAIGQSEPAGPLDPGVVDPGLLVAGPEDLVKLPADRVLLSRGDTGKGEALLGQLIWRRPLAGELDFSQHLLGERVRREKRHGFYYAEDVDQLTLDSLSRLSGRMENRWGVLEWEAGLHLRLEQRDNRTNYWNEFAYAFDLSEGRDFSAYASFPQYLAPGALSGADGRAWYVPSSPFGTPESTDSELLQAAVSGGLRQDFGAGWSLRLDARVDRLAVEAAEPADLVPGGWSDRQLVTLGSGSLSLQREWRGFTAYLTAGSFRGVAGNTVGDGVNLYPPGALHRDDFLNRSRLLEAGWSWQAGDDLLLSGALFRQHRTQREFFGLNDIRVAGASLAADWQIRAGTRLTANAHYLDARYDNAAPAEFGGGSLWNVYAPGAGPTWQGNGLGYIGGFFLNSLAPGDYRIPGLSRWQLNAGIEQLIGDHWSLRLWGGWASSQPGNLAGEYRIPAQMEWNASLAWSAGRWDAQLIARNLFEAANWIHNGDTFFDQMLVSRNLPLRLEGRVRMRF
jgi:hypothetical protein